MGYITTVNQTAENSMSDQIFKIKDTDSYKEKKGAVSMGVIIIY